jgi:excisionase family DNA binding protein
MNSHEVNSEVPVQHLSHESYVEPVTQFPFIDEIDKTDHCSRGIHAMSEARLQDWIRYVQEKAENVPEETRSGAAARRSTTRPKLPIAPALADKRPPRGATERKARSGRSGESEQGSVKQRQRLRPENRAQMLERLTNPLISLHEASVLLGVCPATVRRYTVSGVLPHVRTTGGQRRFRLRDVLALERDRKAKRK